VDLIWTSDLNGADVKCSARTRELPGNYPFVVQELYIKEFINKWHLPSQALVTKVHTLVMKHCKKIVTKHFNHFGQGALEQRVK
jgi:hypothetical protein